MPLISVVIPVFNGEKTIQATLESVLKQTFNFFDCANNPNSSKDIGDLVLGSKYIIMISDFSNAFNSQFTC